MIKCDRKHSKRDPVVGDHLDDGLVGSSFRSAHPWSGFVFCSHPGPLFVFRFCFLLFFSCFVLTKHWVVCACVCVWWFCWHRFRWSFCGFAFYFGQNTTDNRHPLPNLLQDFVRLICSFSFLLPANPLYHPFDGLFLWFLIILNGFISFSALIHIFCILV